MGGDNVGLVAVGSPLSWCHHYFVGMRVEPGTPPAEGAVGDDVVVAAAHEVHVLPAVGAAVPVHVDGIVQRQVLAAPVDVVGEDVGHACAHPLFNVLDALSVVVKRVGVIAAVLIEVVAAADMDGQALLVFHPLGSLAGTGVQSSGVELESLPHGICAVGKIVLALVEPQVVPRETEPCPWSAIVLLPVDSQQLGQVFLDEPAERKTPTLLDAEQVEHQQPAMRLHAAIAVEEHQPQRMPLPDSQRVGILEHLVAQPTLEKYKI